MRQKVDKESVKELDIELDPCIPCGIYNNHENREECCSEILQGYRDSTRDFNSNSEIYTSKFFINGIKNCSKCTKNSVPLESLNKSKYSIPHYFPDLFIEHKDKYIALRECMKTCDFVKKFKLNQHMDCVIQCIEDKQALIIN